MAKIRQLSPELAAKARDELNEVESRLTDDIAALQEWIAKQPHLKARTNDQLLLSILRGSKHTMEKAKSKIDYFYTVKTLTPELFLNRKIDEKTLQLARLGPLVPLPNPLKADGPRLHITRYGHIDPNEFTLVDILRLHFCIYDIEMLEDDNLVIGGTINIYDMAKVSMRYLLQLEPLLLKKVAAFGDKASAFRIKGMHVINMPKEAVTIINFALSLWPKKLRERIKVHPSLESLHEHIPKEYLPIEYGGQNCHLQETINCWEKRLLQYKDYLEEDDKYVVDEKLRIGTKIDVDSLFGLEGSFRKLEVD